MVPGIGVARRDGSAVEFAGRSPPLPRRGSAGQVGSEDEVGALYGIFFFSSFNIKNIEKLKTKLYNEQNTLI